ncbi:MAG: Uma2 family endonuclease [Bacteroidetes bacterium]|nr:MAG: Uma2 family endonuclease [Bacteroidota bacterium]
MAVITDISQLDLTKTYTYADYLTWRFDEMVELLRGYIYKMSPAPNTYHQRITGSIFTEISYKLKKNKCKVFIAPFDVRLKRSLVDKEITTVVQPDVCIVCNPELIDTRGCNGAPDFVLEVLSPFTSKKDLTVKYKLYEEAGVSEYWVVYPGENILEVYLLTNGSYVLANKYGREDKVKLKILPNLEIDLMEVFDDVF